MVGVRARRRNCGDHAEDGGERLDVRWDLLSLRWGIPTRGTWEVLG